MNINEHAEELKKEEQKVLDILITKMDKVIRNLDQRMQGYVEEARNTDISINPDSYLAKVLAQQGLKIEKIFFKQEMNYIIHAYYCIIKMLMEKV